MASLVNFVESIRDQQGCVPYPDPLDGGVSARLLLLLETPGPRIFQTSFVSRDNPTGTAANLFRYLGEAGILRRETLIWNAVPWVIHQRGALNRPPRRTEIVEGLTYLPPLLRILPHLRAVILLGRVARTARGVVEETCPNMDVIEVPHPSPTYVCTSPAVQARIREGLQQARTLLSKDPA